MSGALPLTDFNALNFKSNQKTLVSSADDGTQFTRQVDGQRFSFTLSFPLKSRTEINPLIAFIMKQRSRKETFTITLPQYIGNAKGTVAGSPTGTASAGATSITLGGTRSGSLLAGDLIKFASHNKIYMVVTDNSDISSGTLTIEPPLKETISGSAITFDSVPITVRLTNDIQEFSSNINDVNGELLYNFELDVVEAI
tara:strand:+ start:112 stop:705 length:594 start_codon:yes stop_codon:yes gene_type:complete